MERPEPAEAATDLGHDDAAERARYSAAIVFLCAAGMVVVGVAWAVYELGQWLRGGHV